MVSSRNLKWCGGLLLGVLVVPGALALDGDQVLIGASFARMHDNNLFRLSDDANTAAVLGRDDRGDDVSRTGVSLAIDKQLSLQRLRVNAAAQDVAYGTYSTLDHRATQVGAQWLWAVQDWATGKVASSRDRTLTGFADFRPGSALKNLETRMEHRFDADIRLGVDWHLDAGAVRRTVDNSSSARQTSDYEISERLLGVRHVSAAGREVGVRYRWTSGEYPNRLLAPTLDNRFRQDNVDLTVRLPVSGASRVSGTVGRVERRYDDVPARNYAGSNGRIAWDWMPGGKSSMTLAARRELVTQEDFNASFLDIRGLTWTPVWMLTEHLTLQGSVEKSRRSHEGDPGFFPLGLPTRVDRIRSSVVSLAYEPRRWFSFSAAVQEDRRTSNYAGLQYRARMVTLSGSVQF